MSIASVLSRWQAKKNPLGGGGPQSQALDELTRYIPTETITLFVASIGILSILSKVLPSISHVKVYLTWALITPLIVLLVAIGKHRGATQAGKFAFPTWPMCSATFAFLVWGLAVPGMVDGDAEKMLAAFCALVVSKFLSLLEPIFG